MRSAKELTVRNTGRFETRAGSASTRSDKKERRVFSVRQREKVPVKAECKSGRMRISNAWESGCKPHASCENENLSDWVGYRT